MVPATKPTTTRSVGDANRVSNFIRNAERCSSATEQRASTISDVPDARASFGVWVSSSDSALALKEEGIGIPALIDTASNPDLKGYVM